MPTIRSMARIGIAAFLLVLCACSLFFETPKVDVTDVAIVGIDPGGVDVEILARITNPNSFDIVLTGYTYDLQVHAMPFVEGGSSRKTTFPSRETIETRLPVRVTFSTLYELMKRRPDPDRIPYRLNGTLIVDTPLGEQVVPFRKSDLFRIPERYRPSGILDSLGTLLDRVVPRR